MDQIKKYINLKKLFIFLGILSIFLFFDYLLLIVYCSYTGVTKVNPTVSFICIFIKYLVLIGFIIKNYHKYLKEKWFDFKKNIKKYFEISFRNWFIGFIIMIVANVIINYFFKGLGKNEESVQKLITNFPLIAFFFTTVFAPFIEEMIFRKYLQDATKNKYLFMILSGLLFGLVHVLSADTILEYLLIIPYGALGFMFAKTINETDNIYNTIMMHMLHNGILTILSMWVI